MAKSATSSTPKKSHALRKLIGTVAIAGAAYAAQKFIESRRRKATVKKQK